MQLVARVCNRIFHTCNKVAQQKSAAKVPCVVGLRLIVVTDCYIQHHVAVDAYTHYTELMI